MLPRPWFIPQWRERIWEAGIGDQFSISVVRFEEPYYSMGRHPDGGQWSLVVGKTRFTVSWSNDQD